MTVHSGDMSTPVTRGELREELQQLETRFDQKLDLRFEQFEQKMDRKLDLRFEQFEQKFDQKLHELERRIDQKLDEIERRFDQKLEIWGGALLARIESSQKQLSAELARHARAIQESVSAQVAVIDEKYRDLPPRVSRLEDTVFRSKKR